MGTLGSRGSAPCSQHTAPSTNNMAATNMAAIAMAMPPLLPAGFMAAGQALVFPPPGTHSPSPMSASLQTSVVMVLSPSMPAAAGEQREGSAAMDAVACRHCLLPLGRQSSLCSLVPSLQNPTLKCRATTAPAGSRPAPRTQGVPNSRYSKKKNSAGGKHTFPPFFNFVSKPKAHSSVLFSSDLTHFLFSAPCPIKLNCSAG